MNIYAPYTYLIGWSHLNQYYYGVRYAKNCNPDELWTKYHTSSKYVKELRVSHGEPDVIQIRKTFDDGKSARKWEATVLARLNVLHNDKWINRNVSGAPDPGVGKLNPMYGKSHSIESIQKMREAKKGQPAWNKGKHHSEETRKKLSEKAKQRTTNSMQGKHHTKETRAKISEMGTGIHNSQFTGYFVTPWGEFASAVEATKNSPVSIGKWTIIRWCKQDNEKPITSRSVSKSNYLIEEWIGKTFAELGFGFASTEA